MAVKLAKNKKPKENTGKLIAASFLEYMCALWVVVFAVAVPLYMKEGYYQIGVAKYNAYAYIVVFGMPVLLLLAGLYIVFSLKESGISVRGIRKLYTDLSVTDRFVLFYMAATLISFFCSGHLKEAFWGYSGWYMGLFSQLSFILIYFLFSRFLNAYPFVLSVLCATSFYVFVVGILHRLMIDPVGTYENLSDYYKNQFLSTLGQASWYSSFMTTVLPIGIFAFWYFRNHILRAVAGIFMFVGFMTLVTQNTDSAYFGFLAAMLVLFFVSAKDAGRMRRLFETGLLFFLAPKCMEHLLKYYPNTIMKWDKISNLLIYDNRIWAIAVLCFIFAVFFAVLAKKDIYPVRIMIIVRNIICIVFALFILAWFLFLVAGAKGWISEEVMQITKVIPYLRWEDNWGNGRGFTWSFTMRMIREMDLKNLLFGVGPDCYAIYGHGNYNEIIRAHWKGATLANAHNEWLNMFVNGGICGGLTYLGIFVSSIVRFIKNSEKRPVLIGFAACVAAYVAHNVFCYQQVLCSPYIFVFMALGEYQIRKRAE